VVYGRVDEDWNDLTRAGLAFLIERAKLGRTTSYTELNTTLAQRTGLRPFDFSRADERAAMGHLLGLIVERVFPQTGLMISALVIYLGENDAGSGFYAFATDLGLLPARPSDDEKFDFWVSQVTALYAHYG
jgi:hypothetical protein